MPDNNQLIDFFVDENIIGRLPRDLQEVEGVGAILYPGHPDTPSKRGAKDIEIFSHIGGDGYGPIMLTFDRHILQYEERRMLRAHRVRVVIFASVKARECRDLIIRYWDFILTIAKHRGPSAHRLTPLGVTEYDLSNDSNYESAD